MMRAANDWLQRVPITDAVDRRNAPAMQVLLLFLGATLPLAWAYHVASAGMPKNGYVSLFADMLTASMAFVCLGMIRRGRFRPAIMLFLATLLLSLEISYVMLGFQALITDHTAQLLLMVISGLVLGRRALWIVFAALLVVAGSGFAVDAVHFARDGKPLSQAVRNVPSVLFSYTVIAWVLDRCITALRESLAESNARGQQLRREMAERERAQAQLIHSQKMEATGRLASGIAHDFNNILGIILGFASQRHRLVADAASRAESLEESLEGVEIAAKRGSAISRKLLRFGRHDVAHAEVFDVAGALHELKPMLQQMFDSGIALEIRTDPQPFPVRLDRSQFELMILNIAANARDALHRGGEFSIHVARQPGDGDEKVLIRLMDTGQGMSEEVLRRIFDPFFSTKPADSGTGLGLSVVRDLVENAGGRIETRSAPGEGTNFTLTLPLAGDPPRSH